MSYNLNIGKDRVGFIQSLSDIGLRLAYTLSEAKLNRPETGSPVELGIQQAKFDSSFRDDLVELLAEINDLMDEANLQHVISSMPNGTYAHSRRIAKDALKELNGVLNRI